MAASTAPEERPAGQPEKQCPPPLTHATFPRLVLCCTLASVSALLLALCLLCDKANPHFILARLRRMQWEPKRLPVVLVPANESNPTFFVLDPSNFSELLGSSYEWAAQNVPFLDFADDDVLQAYYYRWRVFNNHMFHYEDTGWVVTEFLPTVGWAGKYNTISCAAGFHIADGRWIRDPAVMDNYTSFWLNDKEALTRMYTFWVTKAVWDRFLVDGRKEVAIRLLPKLMQTIRAWNKTHFDPVNQCFFQRDTWDGGEASISGDGCRTQFNAVMYGELVAAAHIHLLAGKRQDGQALFAYAERFRKHILRLLWDPKLNFMTSLKVRDRKEVPEGVGCRFRPEWPMGKLVPVRELFGVSTPFYFGLIPENNEKEFLTKYLPMWNQVFDRQGFRATWGPMTAERRHAFFNFSCPADCQWSGQSWPYETGRLIAGLGNLLNDYPKQVSVVRKDYYDLLVQFARVHTRSTVNNPRDLDKVPVPPHPWIGENIQPDDGTWTTRLLLWRTRRNDKDRDYMYNHSTFLDLIITGLIGIRPSKDNHFVINPMVPDPDKVPWFALDNVPYHGHTLTVIWDRDGTRYGKGIGLQVFVDGIPLVGSPTIKRLTAFMPSSTQGTIAPGGKVIFSSTLRQAPQAANGSE